MLIRNIRFANSQLLVSGKKIFFNNDGTADITDPDLFAALLKIKGFTDASQPQLAGSNLDLQAVKSISIDELDLITNPAEEPIPEEPVVEEPVPEESEPKPHAKSKKKGR